MRLIKLAVISIVVLFALATFLGALLPSVVLVSRAVNVNAPRDSILLRLRDINQWRSWMEGMNDTSINIVSAQQARLGTTQVQITAVSDSAIYSTWTSRNGNQQQSLMRLISEPRQEVCVVQWQFEQKLRWYPWEKLGSIMNDKILGTMMEKNLNELKSLVEKKQ